MRKKAIIAVLFLFLSIPSVFACSSPVIYSHEGPYLVPVSIYTPGWLIIDQKNYPSDQKMILYNLTVDNGGTAMTLDFNPSTDLLNYFYGSSFYIEGHTREDVGMYVYIDGPSKTSSIEVTGTCSGGFPDGTIYLMLIGRGHSAPPTCGNSDNSCGVYPNCADLTGLDQCSNGFYMDYYCLTNTVRINQKCTNYCCGLIGGACGGGSCVTGSSTTTTTTIPGTTTTTVPGTTTTTIPQGTSGCDNGYYVTYNPYSKRCTNYCCNLIGGTCQSGTCFDPSSSTTTTVPGSTTTTTTIPQGTSGCDNGYYVTYNPYSKRCTNYCCGLIGGTCQSGTCPASPSTTTTTIPGTTTTTIPSTTCTDALASSLTKCYENGLYRMYYCSGNNLMFNERCTNYCCGLVNGKCQSSACVK